MEALLQLADLGTTTARTTLTAPTLTGSARTMVEPLAECAETPTTMPLRPPALAILEPPPPRPFPPLRSPAQSKPCNLGKLQPAKTVPRPPPSPPPHRARSALPARRSQHALRLRQTALPRVNIWRGLRPPLLRRVNGRSLHRRRARWYQHRRSRSRYGRRHAAAGRCRGLQIRFAPAIARTHFDHITSGVPSRCCARPRRPRVPCIYPATKRINLHSKVLHLRAPVIGSRQSLSLTRQLMQYMHNTLAILLRARVDPGKPRFDLIQGCTHIVRYIQRICGRIELMQRLISKRPRHSTLPSAAAASHGANS